MSMMLPPSMNRPAIRPSNKRERTPSQLPVLPAGVRPSMPEMPAMPAAMSAMLGMPSDTGILEILNSKGALPPYTEFPNPDKEKTLDPTANPPAFSEIMHAKTPLKNGLNGKDFAPRKQDIPAKNKVEWDPNGAAIDRPTATIRTIKTHLLDNKIAPTYTMGQYTEDRKKQMEMVFNKIVKPMNTLIKDNYDNLIFDQKTKFFLYHDQKGVFKVLQDHLKKMMPRGEAQSIIELDKLTDIINKMEPLRETSANKEAVSKFNGLVYDLNRFYENKDNHNMIKSDRLRSSVQELGRSFTNKDEEMKKRYVESTVATEKKKIENANAIVGEDKKMPPEVMEQKLKDVRNQAEKAYKKQLTKNLGEMRENFQSVLTSMIRTPAYLKDRPLTSFLQENMNDIEKKYNGLRYADKTFMKEFDESGIEHKLYNDIMNPLGMDRYSISNSNILSPTNPATPDEKMGQMMNFIMNGYGYQQMIDMFRQYVSAFADYQNLAIDMAKLGSGRQVQEIERMERARINIADQKDTAVALKKYNQAVHGAYKEFLDNENELLAMNSEKRMKYLQMMANRLRNTALTRMTEMEIEKNGLEMAGRLRDQKAKNVAAQQDLFNLTNMGNQTIMSSMQRGYAQSEAFREQCVNMFMQMALERIRNIWKQINASVKMMKA